MKQCYFSENTLQSTPSPPRYIMLKLEILHARVQRCLCSGGRGGAGPG